MRRLLPLLLTSLLLLVACGNDDDGGAEAQADRGLPPVAAADGADLFEPELEALGLRVTDRGGLVDRSDGGYELSADGDHYALYVEPIDDATYTDDDFVENLVELTKLTAPLVFDTYPGVVSYDICQEPRSSENDAEEPPAITQIELRRSTADTVDWDTLDLATLVSLHKQGTYEDFVYIGAPLVNHPAFAPYLDQLG